MTCAKGLISKKRLYVLADDDYGCDGADFFPVTAQMWESYEKYGSKTILYFYDVQYMVEDDGEINKKDIEGDTFNIFSMDISYHAPDTLEEFQSRYIDIPDPALPKELVKKAKQVNKLQQEIKESGYDMNELLGK